MRIPTAPAAVIFCIALLGSVPLPFDLGFSVTRSVDAMAVLPTVRISEFHYDNTGTDAGEAVEISGPAGTDLTGWSIVLYNGNGGAAYDTRLLSGSLPTTCGARGVIVASYPSNGIQNGSPDAIALVSPAGLVEFLSYEGTFPGVGGVANGVTSNDIGVSETGTEVLGLSLQRAGDGTWSNPVANTFGVCNDEEGPPPAEVASVSVTPESATVVEGGTRKFTATAKDSTGQPISGVVLTWTSGNPVIVTVDGSGLATGITAGTATVMATAPNGVFGTAVVVVDTPPPPPQAPSVRFSELHYDNFGGDANEAVEIEGPAGRDLGGWSVVLYNGSNGAAYSTRALSGVIPSGCGDRGVVVLFYAPDGIQNGSPDGLALVDEAGTVVEFLSYEGSVAAIDGPAAGMVSIDVGAAEVSARAGLSLQRDPGNEWLLARNSFGLCNGVPPIPGSIISITGREGGDAVIPVGFEDQLFANETDAGGGQVLTVFTWASATPAIASIDQDGVFRALAPGTAVLVATAADGSSGSIALPTQIGALSTTARYVGNTEFGVPTDTDNSDDFSVTYPQFTASYNPQRGTPNWVSYELDPTHFGAEDRCDCFTFDPSLPSTFTRYTTADYTGAGAFHGFGIDRGHLARSFDRTSASLDNARTFYFTNIIPQAADLNQGPWADLENHLGDLARTGGKEVYIVAGVAGSKGTVKDEGKIVIPASTWKVAVVMPRDTGLAQVVDYRDLEVIAVDMPNEPGIRNVDWETYRTTVDAIEALSGYDLLSLLPDKVESAVESNTRPPFARIDAPATTSEGSTIGLNGAASFDPNGSIVTYAWNFGDGTSTTGSSVSHTFAQDGAYTVTLIVTDNDGLQDQIATTITVNNVAPAIVGPAAASGLLPGETYTTAGSFSDPGADTWSASVDYGDDSGVVALALSGTDFALSHAYKAAGTFTLSVRVADDDTSSTASATVEVISQQESLGNARAMIEALVAERKLDDKTARSLTPKLAGAIKNIDSGDVAGAVDKIQSTINQIDALVETKRLAAADAERVRDLLNRIIQSLLR
jgi:DNA/RNA endonuclease G (NUC1)